jgi:isopropylmalate/homocitrate/citramalate synthase
VLRDIKVGHNASQNVHMTSLSFGAPCVGGVVFYPLLTSSCDYNCVFVCYTYSCTKVCCDAVQYARFPRVNIIVSTSDIHMKHKLRKTREEVYVSKSFIHQNVLANTCKQPCVQVLALTKEAVEYAMSMVSDVQVTTEDATRSDIAFLCEVLFSMCMVHSYAYTLPYLHVCI